MLVLTRKKGESVIIGDKIVVKILEADGEKVKIGIEAPSDVRIVREELLVQTAELNLESASQSADILDKL